MNKGDHGYWKIDVDNLPWDTRYFFRLEEGIERPDPVSHWQPESVHGPSQIVDHGRFKWCDSSWKGIELYEMIMYELHVGTFTQKGKPPPDPQSIQMFNRSKLNWEKRTQETNKSLRKYYHFLIQLRKTVPALYHLDKKHVSVHVLPQDKVLIYKMNWKKSRVLIIINFNEKKKTVRFTFFSGRWKKLADSSDHQWRGPGSLLPEYLFKGEKYTLRPTSVSIYQEELPT